MIVNQFQLNVKRRNWYHGLPYNYGHIMMQAEVSIVPAMLILYKTAQENDAVFKSEACVNLANINPSHCRLKSTQTKHWYQFRKATRQRGNEYIQPIYCVIVVVIVSIKDGYIFIINNMDVQTWCINLRTAFVYIALPVEISCVRVNIIVDFFSTNLFVALFYGLRTFYRVTSVY